MMKKLQPQRPYVACYASASRSGGTRGSDLSLADGVATCGGATLETPHLCTEIVGRNAHPADDGNCAFEPWLADLVKENTRKLRLGQNVTTVFYGGSATGKTHIALGSAIRYPKPGVKLNPSVFQPSKSTDGNNLPGRKNHQLIQDNTVLGAMLQDLLADPAESVRLGVGVMEIRPRSGSAVDEAAILGTASHHTSYTRSSANTSLASMDPQEGGAHSSGAFDVIYDLSTGEYLANMSGQEWQGAVQNCGFLPCHYTMCTDVIGVSKCVGQCLSRSISWTCQIPVGGYTSGSSTDDNFEETNSPSSVLDCVYNRRGNHSHVLFSILVDYLDRYSSFLLVDAAGLQLFNFRATPSAGLAHSSHAAFYRWLVHEKAHLTKTFHSAVTSETILDTSQVLAANLNTPEVGFLLALMQAVCFSSQLCFIATLRYDRDYDNINSEVLEMASAVQELFPQRLPASAKSSAACLSYNLQTAVQTLFSSLENEAADVVISADSGREHQLGALMSTSSHASSVRQALTTGIPSQTSATFEPSLSLPPRGRPPVASSSSYPTADPLMQDILSQTAALESRLEQRRIMKEKAEDMVVHHSGKYNEFDDDDEDDERVIQHIQEMGRDVVSPNKLASTGKFSELQVQGASSPKKVANVTGVDHPKAGTTAVMREQQGRNGSSPVKVQPQTDSAAPLPSVIANTSGHPTMHMQMDEEPRPAVNSPKPVVQPSERVTKELTAQTFQKQMSWREAQTQRQRRFENRRQQREADRVLSAFERQERGRVWERTLRKDGDDQAGTSSMNTSLVRTDQSADGIQNADEVIEDMRPTQHSLQKVKKNRVPLIAARREEADREDVYHHNNRSSGGGGNKNVVQGYVSTSTNTSKNLSAIRSHSESSTSNVEGQYYSYARNKKQKGESVPSSKMMTVSESTEASTFSPSFHEAYQHSLAMEGMLPVYSHTAPDIILKLRTELAAAHRDLDHFQQENTKLRSSLFQDIIQPVVDHFEEQSSRIMEEAAIQREQDRRLIETFAEGKAGQIGTMTLSSPTQQHHQLSTVGLFHSSALSFSRAQTPSARRCGKNDEEVHNNSVSIMRNQRNSRAALHNNFDLEDIIDAKERRIIHLEKQLANSNEVCAELRQKLNVDRLHSHQSGVFQKILLRTGQLFSQMQSKAGESEHQKRNMRKEMDQLTRECEILKRQLDQGKAVEENLMHWTEVLTARNDILMKQVSWENAEDTVMKLLLGREATEEEKAGNSKPNFIPLGEQGNGAGRNNKKIVNLQVRSTLDQAVNRVANAAHEPLLQAIQFLENTSLKNPTQFQNMTEVINGLKHQQLLLTQTISQLRHEMKLVEHEVVDAAMREREYINTIVNEEGTGVRQ